MAIKVEIMLEFWLLNLGFWLKPSLFWLIQFNWTVARRLKYNLLLWGTFRSQ